MSRAVAKRSAPQPETHGPWQRAVEILGPEGVALLSRDFGGKRVYVPRNPGPDHPLSVCLGHKLALDLADALVQEFLEPPLTAGKRLRILQLLQQGEKPERISHMIGCSRRFVFKVRSENQERLETSRQLPLL